MNSQGLKLEKWRQRKGKALLKLITPFQSHTLKHALTVFSQAGFHKLMDIGSIMYLSPVTEVVNSVFQIPTSNPQNTAFQRPKPILYLHFQKKNKHPHWLQFVTLDSGKMEPKSHSRKHMEIDKIKKRRKKTKSSKLSLGVWPYSESSFVRNRASQTPGKIVRGEVSLCCPCCY